MMARVAVTIASLLAVLPTAADELSGEAIFNRHCIHCHGDSKEAPGTIQLTKRRGEALAVLTERDDLIGPYIEAVVRNGLNAMPPFVPTELDKDKLAALVEFLTSD